MKKHLFIWIVIFVLALLLEGIITNFPFVFCVLLLYSVRHASKEIFTFAFILGLVLDILLLRPMGETSLFFMVLLMLVLLYQRKYEIATTRFTFFACFFGSLLYLFAFYHQFIFIESFLAAILTGGCFLLLRSLRGRVHN